MAEFLTEPFANRQFFYARFTLHQSCGGAAEHEMASNCFGA